MKKHLTTAILLGTVLFSVSCGSKNMSTKAEKEAMEVEADGDTVDQRTQAESEGSLGKRFMEPDSLNN